MTQERNEKIRCNPTQATQESEKKSGGSERKQSTFGLTCLRSDPPDYFSLSWVAWVGLQRIFFVAFLGHIMSLGSASFVAFPKKYHRIGERSLSRVPPVTKIFFWFLV